MSPFIRNGMNGLNQNGSDGHEDDIRNDIVEQIAQGREKLAESQLLTGNKALQEKVQLQDVKIGSLKQILESKQKQLHELNDILKRKKVEASQYRNQRSFSFDGKCCCCC